MKTPLLLLLLLCTGAIIGHTQSASSSVSNEGQAYEYAVGDVMYGKVIASASIVVMQSELRPVTTTGGGYVPKGIAGLEVYPSPSENILYLQPNTSKRSRLEYAIYDADGREMLRKSAVLETGNERQIADVRELPAGQYTMLVKWFETGNTLINAYRIQKL